MSSHYGRPRWSTGVLGTPIQGIPKWSPNPGSASVANGLFLHHTVTRWVEPEGPKPKGLRTLGRYAFEPGWPTKARVLRRYRSEGVRKWNQMDVRRRGDGGWVIVEVDPEQMAEWRQEVARVLEAEIAAMRGLYYIGRSRFPSYPDISYTEVLFPSGRSYDGCVGRSHIPMGTHTYRHNNGLAIALAGDYSRHDPTPVQRFALAERIVARGANTITPHRGVYPTICPGVSRDWIDSVLELI